jgi:hypothetical protein
MLVPGVGSSPKILDEAVTLTQICHDGFAKAIRGVLWDLLVDVIPWLAASR